MPLTQRRSFASIVVLYAATGFAGRLEQPNVDVAAPVRSQPQDPSEGEGAPPSRSFSVAEGHLVFESPVGWDRVEPAVRLIEAEFAVEPTQDQGRPGRITIMGAGGSIQANVDRWLGQVRQYDGGSTRDRAEINQTVVHDMTIHWVDVTGTYIDQRGPEAPRLELADHRLIGAIIETGSIGNYYVKFYGPTDLVTRHRDVFVQMVESATVVE